MASPPPRKILVERLLTLFQRAGITHPPADACAVLAQLVDVLVSVADRHSALQGGQWHVYRAARLDLHVAAVGGKRQQL